MIDPYSNHRSLSGTSLGLWAGLEVHKHHHQKLAAFANTQRHYTKNKLLELGPYEMVDTISVSQVRIAAVKDGQEEPLWNIPLTR